MIPARVMLIYYVGEGVQSQVVTRMSVKINEIAIKVMGCYFQITCAIKM